MKVMMAGFVLLVGGLITAPTGWTQRTPSEIYHASNESVVLLICYNPEKEHRSKGAGSIIGAGYVLTNAHVVLGPDGRPLQKILVYLHSENQNDDSRRIFKNGRRARVLQHSNALDLALLAVDQLPAIEPLLLGNSELVSIGDSVLAIGHPERGGLWSLTSGRIGAVIRNAQQVKGRHVFQTETSLNRGNSGGPLLNYHGQLVGINTSIARRSEDGLAITGINFALQSSVANIWLEKVGFRPEPGHPKGKQPRKVALPNQTSSSSKLGTKAKPAKSPKQPRLLTPERPLSDEELFWRVMQQNEDEYRRETEQEFENFEQKLQEGFQNFGQ